MTASVFSLTSLAVTVHLRATRTVNVTYKPVKVTFNAGVEGVEKVEKQQLWSQ